ncbi:aa_trans domain-containing protein [Trichonephila clavata]|uniref:Aa_trans domain-containing protein n=1 Tax=Trichonephila clavata TaxID=2740835 RepID=A0A8X6LNR4_TRICU|nr:aa_trans domain-containing protein [Trichonephila clavata]
MPRSRSKVFKKRRGNFNQGRRSDSVPQQSSASNTGVFSEAVKCLQCGATGFNLSCEENCSGGAVELDILCDFCSYSYKFCSSKQCKAEIGKPTTYEINTRFLAIVDVSCNLLYMIFLLVGLFIDKASIGPVKYPEPTFSTLALSFGQLMFAYSGGGVYPTIQNDMKDPRLFPLALFSGFLVIYSLYVPLAILGYAAYGKGIKRDITMNMMANKSLRSIARLLQFLNLTQLATTLVIYLNPTFQIFEYLLEVPRRLGYKRCLLRSGLLFLIFLLAYALPLVLELAEIFAIIFVGLLTCVFPAIFYGCLIYKKKTKLNGRNEENFKAKPGF